MYIKIQKIKYSFTNTSEKMRCYFFWKKLKLCPYFDLFFNRNEYNVKHISTKNDIFIRKVFAEEL